MKAGQPSRAADGLILVIDGQAPSRRELSQALCQAGFRATAIEHPEEATSYRPEVVLMPAHGPSGLEQGLALLQQLLMLASHPGVIVYGDRTQSLDSVDACRYLLEGASGFVELEELPEMINHIERCLGLRRKTAFSEEEVAHRDCARLNLIWTSPAMRKAIEQIQKAARINDVTVLITGPTGTGKQLLAEALHRLDEQRRGRPFVTVNCGAIAASLAESELFGHRRGAFTGATTDRLGHFRSADGGTLFLDEIGELDLALQPKLLRVLETKRVRPLGLDAEYPVDVRVVAATHRNLQAMVGEGQFRLDLFYRLAPVHVQIPPLRERREDILPLMKFFLNKHRRFYTGEIDAIDDRVVDVLSSLPFDGNVRELENLVRTILVEKQGGRRIGLADLPRSVLQQVAGSPKEWSEAMGDYLFGLIVNKGLSIEETFRHCERMLMATALKQAQGHCAAAAARLKMPRRTFFHKARLYKLKEE